MKRLEIIIPERKLYTVSTVLSEENITGMSYYRIQGRSKVRVKPTTVGRGMTEYELDFTSKLKVEVVVRDEKVETLITKLLERIGEDVSTGAKLFVVDIPIAVDLVTKKRGESVI